MERFNKLQQVKRRFFAMRNGAVGQSMRQQGAPYRIIFGMTIPEIVNVAVEFGPDSELALQLRANTTTRESLLLAPMLYPVAELTVDCAVEWLAESVTTEVCDVVCHRLVRHHPEAMTVVGALWDRGDDMCRYAALRLAANLLPANIHKLREIAVAEASRNLRLTSGLSRMLLEDIDWRLQGL